MGSSVQSAGYSFHAYVEFVPERIPILNFEFIDLDSHSSSDLLGYFWIQNWDTNFVDGNKYDR